MFICGMVFRSAGILTPQRAVTFRGGGIAYLSDPDSYNNVCWLEFYTPVRATQARQVEG